ncbi:DUF1450 domain-containing protein [Peribacillus saganii]|uniref:DUF1450 domain-containing protein n=1 Tax=Peribacillus saganii TaxID=2303992 RepID=A0A372LPE9_9BACI|nr:DUF1450 domain-containing protein [Peribacillus saganii]RFU69850.1 DUF1450 domain-containing protein [Peribacillus saganii]
MGIVVVEICDGSLITEIPLEEILEKEYPEVAVVESSCLSICGMCENSFLKFSELLANLDAVPEAV